MQRILSTLRTFLERVIGKFLLLFELEFASVAMIYINWHTRNLKQCELERNFIILVYDYMPNTNILRKKDINLCTMENKLSC